MNVPRPKEDFTPLHNMVMRSVSVDAILNAIDFKIFDALEEKKHTVDSLADQFGFVSGKLEVVMSLLDSYGLIREEDGKYINTELASEYLVSSAPLYQGKAMALTMDFCKKISSNFGLLLKGEEDEREDTDRGWSATDTMEGTAQEAMGGGLYMAAKTITELPGFSEFKLMADIGGNHGSYTMSILDRNPEMKGVIVDLPNVAAVAQERCSSMGYEGRITGMGVDLREDSIPVGGFDLVLASHVLYAFHDNMQSLLKRVNASLRPGGWFAAHHYAKTGSRMSAETISSLDVITRLAGYFSHFIEPDYLEEQLAACGFGDFQRTCTDENKGIILLTARKN